jgi:serine/threonine protein kinase
MVTGQLPFSGNNQQEIFDSVCNAPVPQLKDFSDTVNPSLQVVIDKSMQKNGADRYASCEEFEDALLESLSANIEEGAATDTHKRKRVEKKEKEQLIEKTDNNDMKIITVGRETSNDIVIPDSFVGRHHLQLIKDEAGAYFVRDLNSTNGTFVNGQKIQGEVAVDEQDVIRIGNTTLPWISYFAAYNETEVASEETKRQRRNNRRKKNKEQKQVRKDKTKKALGGAGKWILRTVLAIGTSVLMMMIFRMIMNRGR